MTDPWDERHINLHEWLIFMIHLSKYTIHGSKKGMEKIPCCIKSHYNMYMSLMYMYSLTRSLPDLFTINSLVFPLAAQPIFKLHLRVEVQSSPFFLLPSCVWSPDVGSPSLKYEKRPYTSGDEKGRIILKP